jgi:hypothetical protein
MKRKPVTYNIVRKAVRADDQMAKVDCFVEYASGPSKRLRHVCIHSPDGFEVGHGGSGPSDLALSILAHHFGEGRRPDLPRITTQENHRVAATARGGT